MPFSPVVMTGYSRDTTLAKSLLYLSRCYGVEKHECYLFLDAPNCEMDEQKCLKMRMVAEKAKKEYLPNLNIILRERNYGVPGNLIDAITNVINQYDRVIFFEDDVLVSRTFIEYIESCLKFYEADSRIFCINGFKFPYLRVPRRYKYDIYLNPRNMAWGFGIWKDRWSMVDFRMEDWNLFKGVEENLKRLDIAGRDLHSMIEAQLVGKIHTWDVQCSYYMVKNGLFAIEPRYSLTKNIGFGGNAGVHCGYDPVLRKMKFFDFSPRLLDGILPDEEMMKRFQYSLMDRRFVSRCVRLCMRKIKRFGPLNDMPKAMVRHK